MLKIAFWFVVVLLLGGCALYLVGRYAARPDVDRGVRPKPPTAEICTEDAKMCPDGTAVGRDGSNGCEFFPCPAEEPAPDDGPIACTMDARICPDGSGVGRDGARGCAFQPCPGEGTVTGTVTNAPSCPYETVFDKPCPTSPYEGDLRLEPKDGGVVTIVDLKGGKFYATLAAGAYKISSGRVLPRCDDEFTVTDGGETTFAASCDSGIR